MHQAFAIFAIVSFNHMVSPHSPDRSSEFAPQHICKADVAQVFPCIVSSMSLRNASILNHLGAPPAQILEVLVDIMTRHLQMPSIKTWRT
jgi:hypothetical protein